MPRIDAANLVEPTRVHRDAYTDPDIYNEEMERIFGGTWTYVAHESQLPNPGDYISSWLGHRPILVTRSRNGELNVLINRCRHRGVILAGMERGNASSFRCEYHGWTYRATGELSGVPYPRGYGDCLDKTKLSLGKLRVESVNSFIFATFSTEIDPLVAHLGDAVDAIAEWTGRAPGGAISANSGARQVAVEANWKVIWDNSSDGYHPAFTHRSLLEIANRHREGLSLSHFSGDPDDLPMRTFHLGNGNFVLDQRASLKDGLWKHARPVPGAESMEATLRARVGDEEAARYLEMAPPGGMNISVFPNLLINGNFITTLRPIDPQRSVMIERAVTFDGAPAEINWLRLRFCEDFVNFGEPDDIEMFQRSQVGFVSREVAWSDMSRGVDGAQHETDDRGRVSVPVSNEAPLRSYWKRWTELMTVKTDGIEL